MNEFLSRSVLKNSVSALLLFGLLWLGYQVLRDFFSVIAWTFIVAYIMWPAYEWLNRKLRTQATVSAAVMTGIISLTVSLALYWLVNLLQNEIRDIYQALSAYYTHVPKELPGNIKNIPGLGSYLQHYLDQIHSNESGEKAKLIGWARQWLGEFGRFLGGLGKNIMQLGFILVALFFFFRDGQAALSQLRQGLNHILGNAQMVYWQTAGDTTRAVVYGLVLAALGQGLISGIGYAVAGVDAPVLLGVVTALFALIPMGATLIWVPVSLGLLLAGDYWHGIGLFLWGAIAISTIDNVIRPLVISGAGRIPFLVVLFGVFGGLSAFGAVGLFTGPVILSVLLAAWKTWLSQKATLSAQK